MSAASGERSFSGQRRVKTYLRSTMSEARYSNLMVLHVNKDRTDKLNLQVIAKDFVQKNERRIRFLENFNMFICINYIKTNSLSSHMYGGKCNYYRL